MTSLRETLASRVLAASSARVADSSMGSPLDLLGSFTDSGTIAAETKLETGLVGRRASQDVSPFREPDVTGSSLSHYEACALPSRLSKKFVFAPANCLDRGFHHQYRIDFQELPFRIVEAIERPERWP